MRPRSADKCAELILNNLLELRRYLDISFADNTCNPGDVETKHAGPPGISSHFTNAGAFEIFFLGRKARKDCMAPNTIAEA